jgi:hypothetical protein
LLEINMHKPMQAAAPAMKRLTCGLLMALGSTVAPAAPMGFKGGTMAMADVSPNWREAWVNHALTARDAFGLGGVYMRSDDKRHSRTLAELTYTRLAQRWNFADAQANVWLFAGLGSVRGNDFAGSKPLWAPGVQLDYETTRIYLAGTARLYRAQGLAHDVTSLRAGFSFYETDYDEAQPWLVLEARRMRGLSGQTEITPMLRLIHKRYFVEFGINNDKQVRANLMYTY